MIYSRADVITDSAVVLAPVEVRDATAAPLERGAAVESEPERTAIASRNPQPTPAVVLSNPQSDIGSALAEQPCPQCGGWGWTVLEDINCDLCGGKRSVRPEVGVVVEQWRTWLEGTETWSDWQTADPDDDVDNNALECADFEPDYFQRRLRVVRYGRPTDALRVSECWQGRHQHGTTGLGVFLHANGEVVAVAPGDHGGVVVVPIREPWAADLQPGQTVLLFDQLHECDEAPPDSGDTETEQEQP